MPLRLPKAVYDRGFEPMISWRALDKDSEHIGGPSMCLVADCTIYITAASGSMKYTWQLHALTDGDAWVYVVTQAV